MHKTLILYVTFSLLVISKAFSAETIQIVFSEHDSYSIEVAYINVGDTVSGCQRMRGTM